ncbi:MAG: restriction endonuclease [Candidatus Hydrothermarchaeota archaeon]|nr:restriction endonuclease [Candidatus Hydrothermarchaeota archaeon]
MVSRMTYSDMLAVDSWQELEELTRRILEAHGYECDFRRVFKTDRRKYEVDVIARKAEHVLAIDCKHYLKTKSRRSALKVEAKKHFERCGEYTGVHKEDVVPVIITLLDDALFYANGCIVVPLRALNDFLLNNDDYLDALTRANLSSAISIFLVP